MPGVAPSTHKTKANIAKVIKPLPTPNPVLVLKCIVFTLYNNRPAATIPSHEGMPTGLLYAIIPVAMCVLAFVLGVLTCASELSDAIQRGASGESFDLEATISFRPKDISHDFAVEDTSGAVLISPLPTNSSANLLTGNPQLHVGTRVRARGIVSTELYSHSLARCRSIDFLGTTNMSPSARLVDFAQINAGTCDARPIQTTGVLRDYFTDEIDPNYLFLILNQDGMTLYAATSSPSGDYNQLLDSMIGQKITISGICDPFPSGCRRKIGRLLQFDDMKSLDFRPATPTDPFAVPAINILTRLQSSELPFFGRRRLKGRVIAVWQENSLLIVTAGGGISRIDLAKAVPPRFGETIEVVGFPETDLYRVNFTRAIWRPAEPDAPIPPETISNISANAIMTGSSGGPALNAIFHGRTVRLRGTVRSLPSVGNDGRFYLESDGYTLPVDISANPALAEKLEIGSVINVTGVCVMDIENWRPNLVFPHIKEVMIVTRTPDDIVVIRRPPWWTPARLSIVIGSLLAVLIGILIWNRALKALAEKRGKALANEELERLESDLKVCERTRLAVELHDSIAQNLTGVSMEIDTALRGEEPLPESAAQHMGRALRTIDSCRGELRNCLWDLRSQALEEEDMNKAIRLTLSQTIGKANLTVRFNVPRSRFTDNTAHTLLRIIRELAANAVRHGHATEIKVAGSIENNILKFSVRDNGCGFDPDACPGVLDGHFGLQGVRERVASFEGSIRIESAPGKGTRVSVLINTPQTDDKEKI